MMCNVVAAILNIILDYLFIFPFGWGMFGAALASAIGTTVGALMIVFYLTAPPVHTALLPRKDQPEKHATDAP